MKPRKSTVLVALLALLLARIRNRHGPGHDAKDQKKKADSCCAEGANVARKVRAKKKPRAAARKAPNVVR